MIVVRCTEVCLNVLGLCWLQRFLESLLLVAYRNYARMRH
jgi:hypothetical protein